jgi:hypothetical protein
MQERFKIYDLLAKEFTTYPPCNITPEGLTLIAERLDKRFTFEQVERAMGRLAYKSKFFPSLAEIVEEISGTFAFVSYSKQKEQEEADKLAWIEQQVELQRLAREKG